MNEEDDSSVTTVDQSPPRNQMNPMANPHLPSPPTARRILVIPNPNQPIDIVNVLSAISTINRQSIYILNATGYVSQATLMAVPFGQALAYFDPSMRILYLTGWFHPVITNGPPAAAIARVPLSRANGILHVSLRGVLPPGPGVASALALRLIAYTAIEVDVLFVCRPGSPVQPDAPGGPIRRIYVPPLQLPAAQ